MTDLSSGREVFFKMEKKLRLINRALCFPDQENSLSITRKIREFYVDSMGRRKKEEEEEEKIRETRSGLSFPDPAFFSWIYYHPLIKHLNKI